MGKTRGFCASCTAQLRERTRRAKQVAKDQVYAHYGGYRCACCGETEPRFLSIDHINGHPQKARERPPRSIYASYTAIIRRGFPADLQILCMNCNWGRRFTGVCPHKQ
jgi:hypothetical protein